MNSKNLFFVVALAGLTLQSASATAFTFNAVDSGWYRNDGNNAKSLIGSSDVDYFAGEFPVGNGFTYRNFFTFNISGVVGTITSATLTLDDLGAGAVAGAPVAFNVGSVSDAAASVGGNGISTMVYNDLSGGTLFGTVSGINAAGSVVVNLNAAALTALASAGSGFVIGGYITPIGDQQNHYLFTNTGANSTRQLVINTASTTPEPGSMLLIGSGLLAFGLAVRRRA